VTGLWFSSEYSGVSDMQVAGVGNEPALGCLMKEIRDLLPVGNINKCEVRDTGVPIRVMFYHILF
jgi:hypothetical protein